jgi:tetratricopeptide (TPR) repeat protein
MGLAELYAQVGRIADARAAISRALSAQTKARAKMTAAVSTVIAGTIEMIAGDLPAAEELLRQGCQALRATRERDWFLPSTLPNLAEALYAQGRLDEAEQVTEEAQALAGAGDFDGQARWRATRAKILARRGQHAPAKQLADEAETLAAPTSWTAVKAEVLEAKAEVLRLGGAAGKAETCLRTALDLHEQRRASALADRVPGHAGQPHRPAPVTTRPGRCPPGFNNSATSPAEPGPPGTSTPRRSP